jgi:MFS family permease
MNDRGARDATAADTVVTQSKDESASLSGWLGLGALSLVNIYAVMDRSVFSLLAEPIRRELALSDTQLGLLQGVGLAMIGMLTVYPIAWIADRVDRRWVSAAVIVLWSFAILGCSFSSSFAWLFFFASLVGIGEAARGPISYAMVPDMFSMSQRQLVNSIYAIVSTFGASGGLFLTGLLIAKIDIVRSILPANLAALPDWRLSLMFSVAMMPLAVLLTLTLPRRSAGPGIRPVKVVEAKSAANAATKGSNDQIGVAAFVKKYKRAQFGFYLGLFLLVAGLIGSATFFPVILARDYGQSPLETGSSLASLGLITAAIGFACAAIAIPTLQRRYGANVPMISLAIASAFCAIIQLMIPMAESLVQLYVLWGLQGVGLTVGTMTAPTVIQNMSPRHLRARMLSFITVTGLCAVGLGTVAVGAVSDGLKGIGVARSLLMAGAGMGFVLTLLAAFVFWRINDSYMRLAEEVNA